MKSFNIVYSVIYLLKKFPVTAHNMKAAKKEFRRLKGDYPIIMVLKSS